MAEKGPSPFRHFAMWVALWWMGAWAVVSPRQVMYDRFFDAATFAIEAQESGDTMAYHLALTFDEGRIQVPQGSTLVLRLRDRSTITLATDREVGRGDIMLRRWRDHTTYYITCHYPITNEQLARMLDKDVYRLEITTARGTIVRPVRNFKSRLSTALNSINTPPIKLPSRK